MYVGQKSIRVWVGKPEVKIPWEDLSVDRRMIFKCIFNK
jgi:hypothetical protein